MRIRYVVSRLASLNRPRAERRTTARRSLRVFSAMLGLTDFIRSRWHFSCVFLINVEIVLVSAGVRYRQDDSSRASMSARVPTASVARMRHELMAVISSNHCHLFYRHGRGGTGNWGEKAPLRSLAGKLLVWSRRCDLRRLPTR